jgi:hypothetical protein
MKKIKLSILIFLKKPTFFNKLRNHILKYLQNKYPKLLLVMNCFTI